MVTKKLTAFDFCRAYLKRNPKATFAKIRDAAAKKRLKLYPISYGRAQSLEGIVKTAKYGASKKKRAKQKAVMKRRPGRPRGNLEV